MRLKRYSGRFYSGILRYNYRHFSIVPLLLLTTTAREQINKRTSYNYSKYIKLIVFIANDVLRQLKVQTNVASVLQNVTRRLVEDSFVIRGE